MSWFIGPANKNFHHLITWTPGSLKHTLDSCRYSEIYLNPLNGNYNENCTLIEVGWEYYRACSTPLRSGLGWAKHLLIGKYKRLLMIVQNCLNTHPGVRPTGPLWFSHPSRSCERYRGWSARSDSPIWTCAGQDFGSVQSKLARRWCGRCPCKTAYCLGVTP